MGDNDKAMSHLRYDSLLRGSTFKASGANGDNGRDLDVAVVLPAHQGPGNSHGTDDAGGAYQSVSTLLHQHAARQVGSCR